MIPQLERTRTHPDFYRFRPKVSGGEAFVEALVHDETGDVVIVKEYRKSGNSSSRARSEAEILEKVIGKDYLPQIIAAELDLSCPKIWMEDAGKTTLENQYSHYGTKDDVQFLTFLVQLYQTTKAVETLHSLGIVHRDIKPGNIVLSTEGKATVIDFGLSYLGKKENDRGKMIIVPREGSECVPGTHGYLTPESFSMGERDLRNQYSDIYNLGLCGYFGFSGKDLVSFLNFLGLERSVKKSTLRTARKKHKFKKVWIPKNLENVLDATLEPKWWNRPDATELVSELEWVMWQMGVDWNEPKVVGSW